VKSKAFLTAVFMFIGFSICHAASGYQPLATIPGLTDTIQGEVSNGNISRFFSQLYNFGVAAAAGLAVIMVIWGGIEYITSVAGEGKSGGKERITSAILGLLLALGSYVILKTINVDLTKTTFEIKPLTTTNK
jgi:amino acid transporter